MNRSDFIELARLRIQEAQVLLANEKPEGAYYLCGYAVECALKACIARQTKEHDFPDKKIVDQSYSHNLVKLVGVGRLETALESRIRSDPTFNTHWSIVKDWSEQSRYERHSSEQAHNLYTAVTCKDHGILQWLEHYW
ncbi:MAG: HEPN domain-containing protein [Candidatus Nealsonbacteria bacterium]|nr:HEPN domain-containing protein [Candidatus Nealsonbacteria bacterium]